MIILFTVIFTFLLYTLTKPMKTVPQIDSRIGYQCGSRIFENQKIEEALEAAVSNLEIGSTYPALFKGLLYGDDSGFLIWPIKIHGKVFRQSSGEALYSNIRNCIIVSFNQSIDSPGPHFIVINQNKELVDLIVRMSDQNYIKCPKYDPSKPGIIEPAAVKDSNGYQCGHIFFSDQILLNARDLGMKVSGKDKIKYPKLIDDPFYDKKLSYKIWPIWKTGRVYTTGLVNGGPFYIVFNLNGKIIDVVVRTIDKSFVKCLRDKKVGSASPLDPLSELFVPAPVSGFHCGRMFFKEDYVKKAAAIAAEHARIAKTHPSRLRNYFLEKYNKEPFQTGSYLLPLSTNQKLHTTGIAGIYRAVLSSEFEVLGTIIKNKHRIYNCPKGTIKGKKIYNKNDYTCFDIDFSHRKTLKAAENACKKLNKPDIIFPAIYDGPDFEIEGPYLTYPIMKFGQFSHTSGRYRIVINAKCEVVGALFKEQERFFKCREKLNGISTSLLPDQTEPLIRELYFEK